MGCLCWDTQGKKEKVSIQSHWVFSDGVDDGETNYLEAHNIFRHMHYLFHGQNILIISPYKAQCEVLDKICVMYSSQNIQVMTLDSVQGHEADIVMWYSGKSVSTTFLTPKRTCVLVSRALNFILFGNRQYLLKMDVCEALGRIRSRSQT